MVNKEVAIEPRAIREQVVSVNSRLKTTDIRGKAYVDVAQKVQGFREVFPLGAIVTEAIVMEKDWCAFRATIIDESGTVLASGHAFEEKKGAINTTSYIENCETSAVGRALSFLGIGSVDAIASADEVNAAIAAQNGVRANESRAKTTKVSPTSKQTQADPRARMKALYAQAKAKGLEDQTIQELLRMVTGKGATKDYTDEDVRLAVETLENMVSE